MRARLARLGAAGQLARGRESGQIIVLFAVFVIVLLVLAGSAYDYASIVVDDAKLQNAIDAASLAGANVLASNELLPYGTPAAMTRATVTRYLADNGYATQTPGTIINVTFPTSTPVPSTTPVPSVTPPAEAVHVDVTRSHPTAFWPLVGIPSVNLHGGANAHAGRSMLDIVLSLDTTGSLVLSNNLYDYTLSQGGTTIQDAVAAFINQINPTPGDPSGPKIGIGRYAGVQCAWSDYNRDGRISTSNPTATPTPSRTPTPTATATPLEYHAPCKDDETMLTTLTNDKNGLLNIANKTGTGVCPADTNYACPIQHHGWVATDSLTGHASSASQPYFTGTKEPNAICLVNPGDSLCTDTPIVSLPGFAWSTANGGRNTTGNQARRALIIMTDGQDESYPTGLASNQDPLNTNDYVNPDTGSPRTVKTWDDTFVQLAANLKANPAPDGGQPIDIYVVGFFCTDYNNGVYTSGVYPPTDFCQSKIAYQPQSSRACPGNSYTSGSVTGSHIDDLLVSVSSSTPGTCDHYFPISKSSDSLSQLFQDLAGQISRGQLTQ